MNRPESKNPLTFESYAEIVGIFRAAAQDEGVKAFVVTGEGGNFCSGGDVFEIIGPLVEMNTGRAARLHPHDRRGGQGDARRARSRSSPRSTASAPAPARSSPWRPTSASARAQAKVAFLFNRVGLAGCDMGACAILPRIIGQGRAAELLFTGRAMGGEEAERWGFFNRLARPRAVLAEATSLRATTLADGPDFRQRA